MIPMQTRIIPRGDLNQRIKRLAYERNGMGGVMFGPGNASNRGTLQSRMPIRQAVIVPPEIHKLAERAMKRC